MAARKLNADYVQNLWSMFKTIDEKHIVTKEDVKKFSAAGIAIPQENAQLTLRIYSKAANACTDAKAFAKVLESNEFPPIKLTQKEMEYVKGGMDRLEESASDSSGASSGSCHGEETSSGRSSGSCHGEA